MNRNFSLPTGTPHKSVVLDSSIIKDVSQEESQTNAPQVKRSISQRILRRFHSQRYSRRRTSQIVKRLSTIQDQDGLPTRGLSRRDKIVHVIANPDTLFKQSKPSTSSDSSQYDRFFLHQALANSTISDLLITSTILSF
jgi:hypothetical protein